MTIPRWTRFLARHIQPLSDSRAFTTSPSWASIQRLKKASDVEAKSKAKSEGKWRPPSKRKDVSMGIKIEDTMNPEQLKRWLIKRPVDDVWIRRYYPERVYGLADIVSMHRAANDPSMLGEPDADLLVDLTVNMSGVKKTKPMKSFSVLTLVPHLSPHTTVEPRYVAVLVKNAELRRQLEVKGAAYVGAEDLIAKLKAGFLTKDADYDYIIGHMDIVQELTQLKKKFQGVLPSERDGTLGVNIHEMFDLHQRGYLLKVMASSHDPYVGSCSFSLGKLSFPFEKMMENLDNVMRILRRKRPPNITSKRGVFITEAIVRSPPNDENFKMNFEVLNEFIDSNEPNVPRSLINLD